MNIIFTASEATPFAKTGGLADVCSARPVALSKLGHNVAVMIPAYRQIEAAGLPIEVTDLSYTIPIGKKNVTGGIAKSTLPGSDVPIYFIKHDRFFHRDGLYNSAGVDYQDNCERFIFFCRAVFEAIQLLGLRPDVIHANDWQTGLIPAYLKTVFCPEGAPSPSFSSFAAGSAAAQDAERWKKVRSVFTIHNLRHQGRFPHWEMENTGIDWRYFTYDKMEFYGQLNLLKTGIIFADAVTTVSPEYAREIQTEGFGERLQGVLRYRSCVLSGILNGIDVDQWNPETDPHIEYHYNVDTVFENKPKCKAALQREMGLPERSDIPLFGVVSRFDAQKGLDLIADIIPSRVERDGVQFVILGTGDPELEDRFKELSARYPNNVAAAIRFGAPLSHRIEAGADLFLMPSRYEPCGLNQMYSQRYGTLPVVRRTGGLADTVTNATYESIANGTANGFSFNWGTTEDLDGALTWVMTCWRERRDDWKKMVQTAMRIDHSWDKSARQYLELYEKLMNG
ncbi:MAG: glycogen synthase GlgA [Thermoguttaceae bacterium]|nr:glycogen synthase GlgA [Thermoguttaceae bacterium]